MSFDTSRPSTQYIFREIIEMTRKKCILCTRWSFSCRSLSSSCYEWFHQHLRSQRTVFDENDLNLCSACVSNFYKMKETLTTSATPDLMDTGKENNDIEDNDQFTLNNVIFSGSGHKKCVICRKDIQGGAVTMPKSARLDLLIIHLMYAPEGIRCCESHLLHNRRLIPGEPLVMNDRQRLATCLSSSEMMDLVKDLLSLLHEAITSPRLDFLDPSLNDEDYLAWTGWTKKQFDDMYEIISPNLRSSSNRHARNALAIFWIKLKSNLSFRQIGSMFNIPGNGEDRRKRAADAFDSIRQCLIENFVPRHLGVQHLSRENAKKHNTSFSIEFFGDNVTIIWDGTYLYMGKSSCHLINRKTYSGQK